jgi:tungstate transport system substrate-binding protein
MPNPLKALIAFSIIIIFGLAVYAQIAPTRKPIVKLAATTSVYDSGLLESILPKFEAKYGIEVWILAAGSGQAIEIAKRGDADIVLAHSRDLEADFVKDGYGIHRVGLMYNDFLIVGPHDDPAEINGSINAAEAFKKIAEKGSLESGILFISRADLSGTHMMELSLWRKVGRIPSSSEDSWYIEVNAGMGAVLRMANEKGAYTLVDRGTWLSFRDHLTKLTVLVENDPLLVNPYSLILVNPEKSPHVNFEGALALAVFLISEEGQKLIESFKKDGEGLFKPLSQNIELATEIGFPNQEEEVLWYKSHAEHVEVKGERSIQRTFMEEILNITFLSLTVSLSAVSIGALIGVPLGAFLGLRGFRGKHAILHFTEVTLKSFVNALMGLPPVVAGLLIYLLFNRSGPLGFLGLLYTPTAMIITQLILVVPIIVGVTMSTVASIEKSIRERALSLGATDRQATWVILREARIGILTAIIVALGAAISEVGGIMIAGGNIRWATRTLTTAIITEVEIGNFEMAAILGIILLIIAFIINLALTIIQIRASGGQ